MAAQRMIPSPSRAAPRLTWSAVALLSLGAASAATRANDVVERASIRESDRGAGDGAEVVSWQEVRNAIARSFCEMRGDRTWEAYGVRGTAPIVLIGMTASVCRRGESGSRLDAAVGRAVESQRDALYLLNRVAGRFTIFVDVDGVAYGGEPFWGDGERTIFLGPLTIHFVAEDPEERKRLLRELANASKGTLERIEEEARWSAPAGIVVKSSANAKGRYIPFDEAALRGLDLGARYAAATLANPLALEVLGPAIESELAGAGFACSDLPAALRPQRRVVRFAELLEYAIAQFPVYAVMPHSAVLLGSAPDYRRIESSGSSDRLVALAVQTAVTWNREADAVADAMAEAVFRDKEFRRRVKPLKRDAKIAAYQERIWPLLAGDTAFRDAVRTGLESVLPRFAVDCSDCSAAAGTEGSP